jgi:MFS transporter, FHS family, glucose/mannose:H+ symporter
MPKNATASEAQRLRFVHTILFIGFIVTGAVATILGPILPVFIGRWTLTDSQAGVFFTTQFVGSSLGVVLSSFMLARRGYRDTLILGFFLMAAGVAGLNTTQYIALGCTALYGFGFGLAIPATNLCVAEISGERRAASLNVLNMAYSIGAIACPLLLLAGIKGHHFAASVNIIALCSLLLSIFFFTMKFDANSEKPAATTAVATPLAIPNSGYIAIALGLLFYLYVGTESAISGWAAEQGRRIGMGAFATAVPMFFWAGLLAGRGSSPLFLSLTKEILLVPAGLILSALGTLMLLLAGAQTQIIVGVIVAGLGFSTVYPIFISWLSKWYGEKAKRLGGVMFALAALGGASIPPAVGIVSQHANSLREGLLVPLAGSLTMLGIVVLLRRRIIA